MTRDVLSRAAKMAWDVLSGGGGGGDKNSKGIFSTGWRIDVECFVWDVKKWHGVFCPGMFCPTFAVLLWLLFCLLTFI